MPQTTGAGSRGIVPDGHPLVTQPVSTASAMVKNMADVVLAIGTRFGELDFWGKPPVWGDSARQQVIQVDIDPRCIGLNRPVEVPLVGDAKAVAAQDSRRREGTHAAPGDQRADDRRPLSRPAVARGDERACRRPRRRADGARTDIHGPERLRTCQLDHRSTAATRASGPRTTLQVQGPRSMLWTSNAGHPAPVCRSPSVRRLSPLNAPSLRERGQRVPLQHAGTGRRPHATGCPSSQSWQWTAPGEWRRAPGHRVFGREAPLVRL